MQVAQELSNATGTIRVYNVTQYPSFQAAADAVPTSGGILYFPEGTHVISSPINVRAKTWVLGAGRGTVLQRSGSAAALLSVPGDVTVSDLACDLEAGSRADAIAISASGVGSPTSVMLRVERCTFFSSSPAAAGATACGVFVNTIARVWISNNQVNGVNLVACAGAVGPGVFVTENHVISAPRVAISVAAATGGGIEGAVIADNLVESPGLTGIHVGASAEWYLLDRACGIVVRDNVIRGAWGGGAVGIHGIAGTTSKDWLVEGNVLDNASPSNNSCGIRLKADQSATSIRSLAILQNTVRGTDLAGIHASGVTSGLRIASNRVESTRGIELVALVNPLSDGTIHGNAIRGGYLHVYAATAAIDSVLVRGNVCMNSSGWDSAGIVLRADAGRSLRADVSDNRSSDDQPTKTQFWGARETGSGTFVTRYIGNDFSGNLQGALTGTSSGAVIRDNAGIATETSGVASFTPSTTSVQVLHGLAFTPALRDVAVTLTAVPASWQTNGNGQVRLASTSAQSFTLECWPAPQAGETLSVAWRATVRNV